jgi:hypothetical protein
MERTSVTTAQADRAAPTTTISTRPAKRDRADGAPVTDHGHEHDRDDHAHPLQWLDLVGLDAFGRLNPLLAGFIHMTSELAFILNSARLLPTVSKN